MKIKFIDNKLSESYSDLKPSQQEEYVKGPNGRNYKLLGTAVKNYRLTRQISMGAQIFLKTIFFFCFSLTWDQIRENWRIALTGKERVKIYVKRKKDISSIAKTLQPVNCSNQKLVTSKDISSPHSSLPFDKKISEKLASFTITNLDDWNNLGSFMNSLEPEYKSLFGTIPQGAYGYKDIHILPSQIFEESLKSQKEWLTKVIVFFGSSSLRLSGNWGSRFAQAQALFYMEKLMQRENKEELIQQIKSELLKQDVTIMASNSSNQITPYYSFLSNLKECSEFFPWKKDFIDLLEKS